MDRRNFLRAGGLALAGAAGLPRGLRNQNISQSYVYKTDFDKNKKDQWLYEMRMDHKGFTDFASASDAEKSFTLKIAQVLNGDLNNRPVEGEHVYAILSAEKGKTLYGTWDIETKFIKTISGSNKFEKGLSKNPLLRCMEFYFVEIIGKDNKIMQNLPYRAANNDDGDCFLTSACVQHKQMPDNCEELQLLRGLRDNYMSETANGRELIGEYEVTGPRLVQNINSYENKADIYEYLYTALVIPSVNMVKEGRNKEAVEYYKGFISEMKKRYL